MTDLDVTVHDSTDGVNERRWNTLVEQSGLGSCFQRTEWLTALETGLELDPRHVTVEHDGNLIAVCPNFVADLRLPDAATVPGREYLREVTSVNPGFGGPVIASHEKDALAAIAEAVDDASGADVLSHYVRTGHTGYLRYAQAMDVLGYAPYILNCRFVLDLSMDKEEIVAGMDKDRRYNLRKAKERDPDVRAVDLDSAAIEAFHDRYERVMDRVGSRPYPRSFFRALRRHLGDRILLLAATVDGTDVGQHFYLRDEERSALHHLFSAVEEEHFEYYPSEIMHDDAIDRAQAADYRTYDFGETGANFDDGLFKYKAQFGGRLVPTITWERGLSPLWPIYVRGRRIFRTRNSEYADAGPKIGQLFDLRE